MNFDILQCYNVGVIDSDDPNKGAWLSSDVMACVACYRRPRLYAVRKTRFDIEMIGLDTGDMIRHIRKIDAVCVADKLDVSPDGHTMVVGSDENSITVLNNFTKDIVTVKHEKGMSVYSIAISYDCNIFAVSMDNFSIRMGYIRLKKWNLKLTGHAGAIPTLAWTHDDKHVISGSYDRTVRIWNIETGHEQILRGHSASVFSLAVSPDDSIIASGSGGGQILVWDRLKCECIRTINHHDFVALSLQITLDGKSLLSSSADRTIAMHDIESGKIVHVMKGHTDWVDLLTVSPNGQSVVSASHDGTVRSWSLKTGLCEEVIKFSATHEDQRVLVIKKIGYL